MLNEGTKRLICPSHIINLPSRLVDLCKESGRIEKVINHPGIMISCCYEVNTLTKWIQMLSNMCPVEIIFSPWPGQ